MTKRRNLDQDLLGGRDRAENCSAAWRPIKYIKRSPAKGKFYYYFSTGVRKPNGQMEYVQVPDPSSGEFRGRYSVLLAARKWRETAPATIGALCAAYQRSPAYGRLSASSQRSYLNLLAPLWRQVSHRPIDSLTAEDCAELASRIASTGQRTLFLQAVNRLYRWAQRERFSGLKHCPADSLIVKRAPISEWIYIIGSSPSDPIKIGRARHVGQRLANLQSGNPLPLKLLAAFFTDSPATEERALHRRFHEHRMTGEWFKSHPDIWLEIERLRALAIDVPDTRKPRTKREPAKVSSITHPTQMETR